MAHEPSKTPDWEHWPGRRQPDDGLRHKLRALFAPTDQDDHIERLVAARGRELEERVEQLADAVSDVERREEQVRRLRIAVEEMLRHGSAELDDRHAELSELAEELRERDTRLAELERDVEHRRRELGAVELHRATVERRETAVDERESAFEGAAASLREREHALANAEHRVEALLEQHSELEAKESALAEEAARFEARNGELAVNAARLEELATTLELREQDVSARASEVDSREAALEQRADDLDALEKSLEQRLAETEATRLTLSRATESAARREAELAGVEAREMELAERGELLRRAEIEVDRERRNLLGGREELARAVASVASGLGLAAAGAPASAAVEHLLYVPGERYRLVTGDGPVPGPGEPVTLDDRDHVVVRVGASPLPDDGRPCAILEALPTPPADNDVESAAESAES